MITSVFSKSRPINYILVSILLIISYLLYQFRVSYSDISGLEIARKVFLLLVLVGSLFITNFITKKNALSKDNSFTFYLFFIFLIFFPNVLSSEKLVVSNAFILLALRRLISMQSLITPKEKIFDASLWIFVASLINFWCILFVLLVFTSIIFHVSRDYRNWIIPFIAFITILVVGSMFSLAFYPNFIEQVLNSIVIDFDVKYFQNIFQDATLIIYLFTSLIALLMMLFILPTKLSNLHSAYRKIIFAYIIGLVIYFISPDKQNGLLIYTFVPTAIMLTNYLETVKKFWIKESIVVIITITSLITYLLQIL
ncbi:MAG: DUF6427 family protein [Limnohabitans sp.]|nr:DUF6427 family protein [Limnohabitans sp.]